MIQNIWLTIALYPGCVQGFFLAYLLWQKKAANRQAIGYFNALLLTLSVLMLLRVTYQPAFFKQFAEIILLPDVVLFLTGPFIFLFTRALLRLDRLPNTWLHFIPAAVHVLVVNTLLGLHMKDFLHFLSRSQIILSFHLIEAASMVSLGIYLTLSMHTYRRYRSAFYQKYAAPFIGEFLRTFFLTCFGLLLIWLASFIFKIVRQHPDYSIYTLFWVLVVAAIYFLAYKIWSTPAILELPEVLQEDAGPAAPDDSADPERMAMLVQFMDTEKPYLNPEIKIGDLADALGIPKHQLSRVINQGFGKNFFDFINAYRIGAFIEARKDKKQRRLNTLELAYASGFNSKSAFNRAFFKETGVSPREYFERYSQSLQYE